MKKCNKCNYVKPLTDFAKSKDTKDGLQLKCKQCNKDYREANRTRCLEQSKRYREANKDSVKAAIRAWKFKTAFGITVEDYNAMWTEQKGCCACCGVSETTLARKLAVDHCHKKGHVRALLCTNCNIGIGMFKEDISRLQQAIDYLQRKKYG